MCIELHWVTFSTGNGKSMSVCGKIKERVRQKKGTPYSLEFLSFILPIQGWKEKFLNHASTKLNGEENG